MDALIHEDAPAVVSDLVARFDSAEVGAEIGTTAYRQIPHLYQNGDTELCDETVLAATSNVVAIIDGVVSGADPATVKAPSVSLQWAEWLVTRGVDVSAVPWAYNFGHGRMADALRDVVVGLELPAEDRWTLGEGLSRYVMSYVENVCAQMIDHFVTVEDRWRGGAAAARRELVGSLLNGRATDTAAASAELGYPLERPQVAVVVWTNGGPGPDRVTPPAMARAAEELLRACGAQDVLTIPNGQTSVWGWGSGAEISDRARPGQALEGAMLAAIGTAGDGLAGFVASHNDAVQTRQTANLLGRRTGTITSYRSVALTSLVANDPEQALRFLDTELGPLTKDTDSVRRLRATLAVYFEEGMRPVRTARRLGVHQNTVAYRIAQAEQAIGRPLTERRLELETALRLAEARDALRSAGASARRA